MGTEVPDHAHIALMQAEVHAARGDEEDVAERPGLDHPLDRPHRRAVEERVAAHQDPPALARHPSQVVGQRRRGGERLLHEHVLARAEGLGGQVVVGVHGRGDDHRVDRRVGKHAIEPGRHSRLGMPAPVLGQPLRVEVADPTHLGIEVVAEHAQEVRTPVPEPDDRESDRRAVEVPGLFCRSDRQGGVQHRFSPDRALGKRTAACTASATRSISSHVRSGCIGSDSSSAAHASALGTAPWRSGAFLHARWA